MNIMQVVTDWTVKYQDKVNHFAFGTLFYLPGYVGYGILGGLASCFLIAFLIEALQASMPGRDPSWADVAASMVGAGIMSLPVLFA